VFVLGCVLLPRRASVGVVEVEFLFTFGMRYLIAGLTVYARWGRLAVELSGSGR